jgi:hypothetical protein
MDDITQKTEKQRNSSNEAIYQRFKVERTEWTDKITDMSERLRDVYKLSELLTDIYSQRQIALEYTHTLMSHLSKVNTIFRERKVERYNHYTRNHDIRLEKDPKYDHIHADLNDIVERRELLQNHLDYFRETVRTIDNITFGVKHRMALEEYRRG